MAEAETIAMLPVTCDDQLQLIQTQQLFCLPPTPSSSKQSSQRLRLVSRAIYILVAMATKALVSTSNSSKWVPDHSYDSCFGCLRKFNMFNRRHHCRLCGQLFCKACSSSRVELSPEQGYVRVCDSCNIKHKSGGNISSSIPLPCPIEKKTVPLPRSVFSRINHDLPGNVTIACCIDSNHPIVLSSRLARTLCCNCFPGLRPANIEAIQSAHWTFDKHRLRLDIQFTCNGLVLYSARLRRYDGVFVGASAAVIQSTDLHTDRPGASSVSVGIIEELFLQLRDVKRDKTVQLTGSLAWTVPVMDTLPGTDTNELRNHKKTAGLADRASVLSAVETDIANSLAALAQIQNDNSSNTKGNQSMDDLDRWRASRTFTETAGPIDGRKRASTIHGIASSTLTARSQLQMKCEQLLLTKECIKQANACILEGKATSSTPFSCICFHCFGTITL